MNEKMKLYKKIITGKNHRFTKQKELILKTMLQEERHHSARDIYEKVRSEGIGLATVYRVLKNFTELGIVKEITLHSENLYEIRIFSGKPLHIHFQERDTGRIIDIDDIDLVMEFVKLIKKVETRKGIDIV
jgi:Fe2+ or Zn2+ uptake regulation protein